MPVPTFEFTDRAVPIVQMGRYPRGYRGTSRWGRAHWGIGRWGRGPFTVYNPVWTEVTCDIHEITTNTGRESHTDIYQPGTAQMIASNVTGWGDGEVPLEMPQFYDDFEREGPELDTHWERWVEMETFRAGTDEFIITEHELLGGRAATVFPHVDDDPAGPGPEALTLVDSWSAAAGADNQAPVGPFAGVAAGDVVFVHFARAQFPDNDVEPPELVGWHADGGDDPAAQWFHRRITAEDVATTPTWTARWEGHVEWNWVAFAVRGVGDPELTLFYSGLTTVTGSSGAYRSQAVSTRTRHGGCMAFHAFLGEPAVNPAATDVLEARPSTGEWVQWHILTVDGGASSPTIYPQGNIPASTPVPFVPPPSPPYNEQVWDWTRVVRPGPYPRLEFPTSTGQSAARWGLAYPGDEFVEAFITGLRAPAEVWPSASTRVELYLKVAADDLSSQVAILDWEPDWDTPGIAAGTLTWELNRRLAGGALQGTAFASGVETIGDLLEPTVIRFEAGDDGTMRLLLNGVPLGTATDPTPADGELIGIYGSYVAGAADYQGEFRPGPLRFEAIEGGSNLPNPIYLEPGVLIRIGVWHERYDYCWFFQGYVDALVPTYDPMHEDSTRIECIDALGEVGRVTFTEQEWVEEAEAATRVRRVLNRADWPHELRKVDDDATLLYPPSDGRVVDALAEIAQSCGGAVYGGPASGDVVFRARDWQGYVPGTPPDGFITNWAGVDFAGLVVCPVGWERSWDRADMATRVTFHDGDDYVWRNSDAERRWGIEPYERSLLTLTRFAMKNLAQRILRLRGPAQFPRVSAALLDAATEEQALDMMAITAFTRPHRYRCQMRRRGTFVFNREYFVTGIRHVITPDRWTTRFALDDAAWFAISGGRWGSVEHPRARWGRDTWGQAR